MSDQQIERDLWWEARQKTAALTAKPATPLTRLVSISRPGAPVRSLAVANLGRDKAGLAIDLNKYRPGRDLKQYVDLGVDVFILRIGGPGQWVSGNYAYREDQTWRGYMEQADRLGMLNRTIGYIVHNPFEDWRLDQNVHVDLLNQWTGGGYMPQAFYVDHEVAEVWQGGSLVKCTPFNLVSSLGAATDKIFKKFKKTVGVYTARWFLNTWGYNEHVTWFDNINRPTSQGGPGLQRPTWFAWYGQTFTKEYSNLETSLQDLFTPTGDQEGKYLQVGSFSKASLWQFTDRLKIPGDTTGVDANVTLGTLDQFLAVMGLSTPVQPPTPPVQPPPPVVPPTQPPPATVDLKPVLDRLAILEQKVDQIGKHFSDWPVK